MRRILNNQEGFTLIEVLVYAIIFALLVGTMTLFAFSMLNGSTKADMQLEVTDNARFVTQKLQYILHGATSVDSPVVGSSAASLSITTATTSWNPFVIDVSNGALRFKKGSAAAVPLTDSFVRISSVSFKTYAFSDSTKNTVRFKAQVASVNPLQPASSSIDIFISIR